MNWKDEIDNRHKGQSGYFKQIEVMEEEIDCRTCFGSGTVERDVSSMSDMTPQYDEIICVECEGTGIEIIEL